MVSSTKEIAVGPGRCAMNNGGCWKDTDSDLSGCKCPKGNGFHCQDVDECSEKLACSCPDCSCKSTWGGFDCKCKGNLVYIKGEDTCIAKNMSAFGWLVATLVLSCLVGAGVAGYVFYKYRLRRYMDSEIIAINFAVHASRQPEQQEPATETQRPTEGEEGPEGSTGRRHPFNQRNQRLCCAMDADAGSEGMDGHE